MVVGVAGWPWVRASIAASASSCAMRGQALDDAVERGQHHAVARALEHQRVREVVDVFGSAGEVDELGDLHDLARCPRASRA